MLQRWFQDSNSNFWDQKPKQRDSEDLENSYERLPHQLWNVSKYGPCADAAITGLMPPPLMEVQVIICFLNSDSLQFLCLDSMPGVQTVHLLNNWCHDHLNVFSRTSKPLFSFCQVPWFHFVAYMLRLWWFAHWIMESFWTYSGIWIQLLLLLGSQVNVISVQSLLERTLWFQHSG